MQGSIAIISQNMAGNTNVLESEQFIPHGKHEIIAICRQEVKDPDHTQIVPESYFTENQLGILSEIALNKPSANTHQNVKMTVYGKIGKQYTINNGEIHVSPKDGIKGAFYNLGQVATGFSKGAVWTKITMDAYSILIVNCHLPMDSDITAGYEYRRKTLYKILTELRFQMDTRTYLIVTGDLNFRMDLTGRNQLNILLEEEHPFHLKDASSLNDASHNPKKYTYKFDEKRSYDTCRLQNVRAGLPPANMSCFVTKDSKRHPSRTDRVLLGDPTLKVTHYETFVLGATFDHNGIYCILDLPSPANIRPFISKSAQSKVNNIVSSSSMKNISHSPPPNRTQVSFPPTMVSTTRKRRGGRRRRRSTRKH